MSNSNTEQLLSEYNFYLNEMDTLRKMGKIEDDNRGDLKNTILKEGSGNDISYYYLNNQGIYRKMNDYANKHPSCNLSENTSKFENIKNNYYSGSDMASGEPCIDNIQYIVNGNMKTGLSKRIVGTNNGNFWINAEGKKYELIEGGVTLLRAKSDCSGLILDTDIGSNILNKLAKADSKNTDGIKFLSNFNCNEESKNKFNANTLYNHYNNQLKTLREKIETDICGNIATIDANQKLNRLKAQSLNSNINNVNSGNLENQAQIKTNSSYETQIENNELRAGALQLRYLLWFSSLALIVFMILSGYSTSYIKLVIIGVIVINVFTFLGNNIKKFFNDLAKNFEKKVKSITDVEQESFVNLQEGFNFLNWDSSHNNLISDLSNSLNTWSETKTQEQKDQVKGNYDKLKKSYQEMANELNNQEETRENTNLQAESEMVRLENQIRDELGQQHYFSRDFNNKLSVMEKRENDKQLIGKASKFRTSLMFGGVFLGAVIIAGLYDKFK
jgi:hypothetical protein